MAQNDNIQLFENKRIRTAWDEEKEEWYFSVVDVVAVLTDQPDYQAARNYWKVTKKRLKDEGNETVTACNQLKMTASDGKKRLTDVADTEQLLRIIQSIPSPKAEPFKLWLAQVGRERIEETIDPELTIDRALETYLKKGYSREWINQRLQAIQVRKELTDEWDARGVQKGVEYAILTDEISRAWSGMSTRQYKNLKGLKKENLRDNMTTLELVLNMLAEATTTQFSRDRKPTTFQENLAVAKAGGQVAGRTRKDIESQSDTPVITAKNAAQLNQVVTDLLEGAVSDTTEESKDKLALRIKLLLLSYTDFLKAISKKSIVLSYDTKKPAVRQVFLLCAADSRFIPERGNPLGRTTKQAGNSIGITGLFFYFPGRQKRHGGTARRHWDVFTADTVANVQESDERQRLLRV